MLQKTRENSESDRVFYDAGWLKYIPPCASSLISCGYLFLFLTTYNWLFLAVTAVAGLVSASFYGWLPLYLPELFPTRVRATGQGVAFNFARIVGLFCFRR